MQEENKTILIPTSSNEDGKLTDFQAPAKNFNEFKKSALLQSFKTNINNYQKSDNPIIASSAIFLNKISALQHTYEIDNINVIRKELIDMMNLVMDFFTKQGVEGNQRLLIRYVLSTFADEIISSTYWGKEKNWASKSLLGLFYNETYGGDKFFQILRQIQDSSAKYINLLELMYVILSLGFEGKYRIESRGKIKLDTLRENLFKQIKILKPKSDIKFYEKQDITKSTQRFLYKSNHKLIYFSVVIMFTIIYATLTLSLVSKEDAFTNTMQKEYKIFAKHNIKKRVQ